MDFGSILLHEYRNREDTQQVIVHAVAAADGGLTRTEIARALNRKKTPFLNKLIDELVAGGVLRRGVRTFHNGVQGYEYTLNQDYKRGYYQ